jgi:hypothetical protein
MLNTDMLTLISLLSLGQIQTTSASLLPNETAISQRETNREFQKLMADLRRTDRQLRALQPGWPKSSVIFTLLFSGLAAGAEGFAAFLLNTAGFAASFFSVAFFVVGAALTAVAIISALIGESRAANFDSRKKNIDDERIKIEADLLLRFQYGPQAQTILPDSL